MNTSRLFVVAVGISAYRNARWRLAYARKDAEDVVKEMQRLAGRQFREVLPTMLVDEQATREAIIEALVGLRQACRPDDIVVVYLAGHGVNVSINDHRDRYHFLTVNVESEGKLIESTALPDHTLREHIDDIPGHRLLIIDTCNAGNVRIDVKKGSYRIDEEGHRGPDLDREENRPEALVAMFRELRPAPPVAATGTKTAREGGAAMGARASVSVLAAAGPRHPAAESRHWGNGVFTMAVLEGLRGRALRSGSAISIADLARYTESRVMNETQNLQCPQIELGDDADRPLAQGPFDLSYPVGEQVGCYTVTQSLGEDEEATSYEATAEDRPGQRFVLRASHPNPPGGAGDGDGEDRGERLLAAADLLRRCQHPGILKILDSGHLKGQDGRCYVLVQPAIVQPQALVPGKTLAPRLACRVLCQVAEALAALHAAGALYLGLCPRKVALAEDGTAQLLDCTSVQEAGRPVPTPKRNDEVAVGSPLRYAAPERFAEVPQASDRSDVYSLGLLAHEYLTGHYPYTIRRLEDLRDAQRRPLPLLPVSYGSLVAAMLDPDPQRRPSAVEVAARLRALVASGPKDRWRQAAIAGAVLTALGVVAATGLMFTGRSKPANTTASPQGSVAGAGAESAVAQPQLPAQPPAPPPAPPAEILVPAGRLIQAKVGIGDKDREVPVRSFYLDRTEIDNQRFADWLGGVSGAHLSGDRVLDEDGTVLVNIQLPYSGLAAEGNTVRPREGYQHRPVVQVSFAAAQAFCKAQGKRLPWDMEWELAAAGSGAGRPFPWGSEPAQCAGVVAARRKGQPCAGGAEGPGEVGAAAQDRTPEGLMDLGGNVSEWVDSRALPATAPLRPVRGGSWAKPASSWREYLTVAPSRVAVTLGFRCARDKKGDSQP